MHSDLVITKMIGIIEKLHNYAGGHDYDSFVIDSMLVEACVFNLSQLGETANRIDDEYASAHPEIPWRQMSGLRNRIVHDYDGINLKLIWEIISGDLPELLEKLKKLQT